MENSQQTPTRIAIRVGERRFSAVLADNEAARAFAEVLPLSIDMRDLHANEKYADLPFALPTQTIFPGTIQTGDLMLYGRQTLVIFYQRFDSSYSYTRLGQLKDTAGLAQALGTGQVRISFDLE